MLKNTKRFFTHIRAHIRTRMFRLELFVFLSAVLAGNITVYPNVSPFTAGIVAASCMAHLPMWPALVGSLIGSLIGGIGAHLAGLCGAALVWIVYSAWNRFFRRFTQFEQLLLLFGTQLALLPVFCREGLREALGGLIGIGLSVLTALIVQNAMRSLRTLRKKHVFTDGEQLSISAYFGILLIGLKDVHAFGFSLPVALLSLYAMLACYARGVAGVAVSTALAAVLTVGGGFPLAFVGSIAACTLAGSVLRSVGVLGIVGGFAAGSLLMGTYVYTAPESVNLINLGVSSVLFLVMPETWTKRIAGYLDAQRDRERFAEKAMRRMRQNVSDEIRRTAAVVGEIACAYGGEKREDGDDDTLMQWASQAASGVCADCFLKKVCWKDRQRAAHAVMRLMESQSRGEPIRIFRPFEEACRHMPQIAAAARQAENQYLVQCAMRKKTLDQNGFIHRQLSGIADVIEELSKRVLEDRWIDEDIETLLLTGFDRRGYCVYGVDAMYPGGKLRLSVHLPSNVLYHTEVFCRMTEEILHRPIRLLGADIDGNRCTLHAEEAAHMSASMGTAGIALSQSGVSGDSIGERRMERGRVLYALSDGMGAGERAQSESHSALKLLFDLYDVGFRRDDALESVNHLLLHRAEDMYATLDAVYLDLRSGKAEFMKYGAPPSFVVRDGKLHTVTAEALPAGILNEAVPAIAKATVVRNDSILLFSDGALDALGEELEETVKAALRQTGSSQEAAQAILNHASKKKHEDDMTVMVIRIA